MGKLGVGFKKTFRKAWNSDWVFYVSLFDCIVLLAGVAGVALTDARWIENTTLVSLMYLVFVGVVGSIVD